MAHQSKPQVVQCLACGLLAAEEDNRHLDLASLYADVIDTDYIRYQHAKIKTAETTYKAISAYLPPIGHMLEVGAYCGFFLKVARDQGWQVVGIEPSKWAAAYSREQHGLDIRQASLKEAATTVEAQRGYDAVVMWDVLEHLPDPMDAMRDINRLLKHDGLFCFSTLDAAGWLPKLTGKRWPWIMDMHLFYFDAPGLLDMLRRQGFEAVAVLPYRHYASAEYFLRKIASNLPRPFGSLARPLIALVPHRLAVPLYFGDTKLFICRKAAVQFRSE